MKKMIAFMCGLIVACGIISVPKVDAAFSATLQKQANISGNQTSGVVIDRATYLFDYQSWSFETPYYAGNLNDNLKFLSTSVTTSPKTTTTATRNYTVTFTPTSFGGNVQGYGKNTWVVVDGTIK